MNAEAADRQQTAAPPARLRVLLVEDPPEDAALVTAVLGDTWGDALSLTRVAGLAAAEATLAGAAYDCVLLDSPAPPDRAAAALSRLGASARDAALVLLTADGVGPPPPGADDVLVRGRADGEAIGRALLHAAEHRRRVAATEERLAAARREADRVEAELAEARALGRMGTWTLDAATGRVAWSDDLRRLTGVASLAGDLTDEVPALVHPEDRELVTRMTQRLLVTGEPVEHDLRTFGADGAVHWFHTIAEPVRDAAGAVVGARGVAQDVTEQRLVEAALRRSEARLLEAQALARVGSFERRLDDGERLWTPEVFRILGLDPADGPRDGDEVGRLVHAEDRPRYEGWLAAARRSVAPEPIEFRIVRPDGEERTLQVRLRVEHDDDGRPGLVAGTIHDVTQAKDDERRLRELVDHDPLTGLLSRRRFVEELDAAVGRAGRDGRGGALLIVDLDDFKLVNDAVGHREGDRVLVRLVRAMLAETGDDPVAGRLGGDEFGFVLPGRGAAEARRDGRALLAALRDASDTLGPRGHLRVGGSAGAAVFAAGGTTTGEELMLEAESALSEVKATGRGEVRVVAADDAPPAAGRRRGGWIERLRRALDAEEWTLLRQPIVPLAAGDAAPWGELLLRLRDPDGRLVPPAAFLPVAERIDLIQAIDRWVIRRACELQVAGAGTLSVNLSARSASDPELGGFIQGCLAGTGADPAGLVFELTETAAIADLAAARRLGARLRRLGSRLALDDFGAGFASFYYLKHLDVDVLKIDGEFVTNLPQDPTDRLVVGAVVGIAQGLGVPVVAEWVEDERTLAALRELGVDHVQGFHLGRPEPV